MRAGHTAGGLVGDETVGVQKDAVSDTRAALPVFKRTLEKEQLGGLL